MILLETSEYSIRENKLGFIDLYNKNEEKVKRLGHKISLKNLKKCDDNNFVITFSKMNFRFEHYNINEKGYLVTAFNTTSPYQAFTKLLELNENIFEIMASNKYGISYVLYNWQTRKYYKGQNNLPVLNDKGEIIVSKKLKYDDEMEGLYYEDMLHYNLDPNNFEIKNAYSELQQRNIDFEHKNAKKVIRKECLENMLTLAILQKENLLKTRDEYNKEQSLTRTKH